MRAVLFVMVIGAMSATTCAFLMYLVGRLNVCIPFAMLLLVLLLAAYAARKNGELASEKQLRDMARIMRGEDYRR